MHTIVVHESNIRHYNYTRSLTSYWKRLELHEINVTNTTPQPPKKTNTKNLLRTFNRPTISTTSLRKTKTTQKSTTSLPSSTATTQRITTKTTQKSTIPFVPITYVPPLTMTNKVTAPKQKLK